MCKNSFVAHAVLGGMRFVPLVRPGKMRSKPLELSETSIRIELRDPILLLAHVIRLGPGKLSCTQDFRCALLGTRGRCSATSGLVAAGAQ
jgi:hypothetical protein